MKQVLITGANGQLGKALGFDVPMGYEVLMAGRDALDITDRQSVFDFFSANELDGVINAAAYTAVDKAESEHEMADLVNAQGAHHLALAAREYSIPMVQVSTDFVFDGKQGAPYRPDDVARPLNVYGKTKYIGEQRVQSVPDLTVAIVRTAWVYDAVSSNFVTSMLRLMQERESLGVVADQIGSPTFAGGLATACWNLLGKSGVFHWTDAGVASWYDFAVAIQLSAIETGILSRQIPIRPITSKQYPTPARRPSNSVLDKSGTWEVLEGEPLHWRFQLGKVLKASSVVAKLRGNRLDQTV